ncbi:hypothetical protein [Sphaerisporangium dianthi]|uniref:Uncharacterized protein n=1 Tax=Sphaerisporangium dianthi TaxID=1436120 RepID=A0ABV9CF44_9ACTN
MTEAEARELLINDDVWGIKLAAAYMKELKEQLNIGDSSAFIAYATGPETWKNLQSIGWYPAACSRYPKAYERRDLERRYALLGRKYWQYVEQYFD